MNLSYIINQIVAKSATIETTHHAVATESADGTVASCKGYSTMAITLQGDNILRTCDIYVEGRSSILSDYWSKIPVYNANGRRQPFICLKYERSYLTPLYSDNSVYSDNSLYFANVTGFVEVRTRLVWTSGGIGITVSSLISNNPFRVNRISQIYKNEADSYLVPRDTVFFGRPSNITATTNPASVYPIWIGDSKFVECVIKNNTNKTIRITNIYLHDRPDLPLTEAAQIIPIELIVDPGMTLRVNSIIYPEILNYPGVSFRLNQIGRLSGDETTGTYDITINSI